MTRQLTRRGLLGMGAGLCLPRRLWSGTGVGDERRFLFIFADGGWDTTHVFTPKFDLPGVDMPPESTLATVGGIDFVDAASRPAVRSFFEAHGGRSCIINGLSVPTVAHDRARRLLCTGGVEGTEDWAVRVAAGASELYMAPHLVISGPAYATAHVDQIVRTGLSDQLANLIEGRAIGLADGDKLPLPTDVEDQVSAYLRARASAQAAELAGVGGELERHAQAWALAQEQAHGLRELAGQVNLGASTAPGGDPSSIAPELGVVTGCFAAGMARCAMVSHPGHLEIGWDTHFNNDVDQDGGFQTLFADLNGFFAGLDGRTTPRGTPLVDVVTVVVLSEMGRHPQHNANQGKDHWPDTSVLLVGAGVAGDQVIGGLGDDFGGLPIDLASGEAHSGGTRLGPHNLGATLMALADLDPGEMGAPIEATLLS